MKQMVKFMHILLQKKPLGFCAIITKSGDFAIKNGRPYGRP